MASWIFPPVFRRTLGIFPCVSASLLYVFWTIFSSFAQQLLESTSCPFLSSPFPTLSVQSDLRRMINSLEHLFAAPRLWGSGRQFIQLLKNVWRLRSSFLVLIIQSRALHTHEEMGLACKATASPEHCRLFWQHSQVKTEIGDVTFCHCHLVCAWWYQSRIGFFHFSPKKILHSRRGNGKSCHKYWFIICYTI